MKKGAIGVLSILAGFVAGVAVTRKIEWEKLKKAEKISGKFMSLFYMMNQWVKVKQAKSDLSFYFEKNNYERIAVYGVGCIGETFIKELKDTKVEIAYGIDRRASFIHTNVDIDVILPDDSLGSVDAVVVTVVDSFDEIEEKLREKMDCPIISLEDVIFEI